MTSIKKFDIDIYAVKYHDRGQYGDFKFMIECDLNTEPDQKRLFVYNDNTEEQNSTSYRTGAGNAIIRQYNKHNPNLDRPYSVGIPTGSYQNGGFKTLNEKSKKAIDKSFVDLCYTIERYGIKKLYYSTNDESGLLGQGIFDIDISVREYITECLKNLSNKPVKVILELKKK